MKTLLVFVALVSVAMGQSAFKIKGHSIGESGDDFLRLETATENILNDCHANPPHRVSVEEMKQRKFPDGATKKNMVERAKLGFEYDRNVDDYKKKCDPLVSVFDSGEGDVVIEYPTPNKSIVTTGTWKFESRKLVGLQMFVYSDYAQVRDDLTARVGMKPAETSLPYRNGFGATWSNQYAEWTTRDVHVTVLKDNNPVLGDKLPFIKVETRSKYDAEEKARAAQGSPLD